MYEQIPLYKVNRSLYKYMYKEQYKSYAHYLKQYNKFNILSSNQLISTFLFNKQKTPEIIELTDRSNKCIGKQLKLNICYFDMNIRSMYEFTFPLSSIEIPILFNLSNPLSQEIINMKKLSVVSGNMLYDITKKQELTTYDSSIIQDNKLSKLMLNSNKIIQNNIQTFTGQHQT